MRRTFVLLVATLAALAATVGFGATPAGADPAPSSSPWQGELGVDMQNIFNWSAVADDYGFLAAHRVTTIREMFVWPVIEPTNDGWNWIAADAIMAAADQHDIEVVPILGLSTLWSSSAPATLQPQHCKGEVMNYGNDNVGNPALADGWPLPAGLQDQCRLSFPPTSDAEYAEYVDAVLDRYAQGGTFWAGNPNPNPIRAVEIWNEPYSEAFFKPDPDPERYAELLEAAADVVDDHTNVRVVSEARNYMQPGCDGDAVGAGPDAVRDHKPQCPSLSAMEWTDALMDEMSSPGATVDVWSVHPYPDSQDGDPYLESGENAEFGLEMLDKIIADTTASGAAKPIWITEIGWQEPTFTAQQQAEYLDYTIDYYDDEYPTVERIYAYSFRRNDSYSIRYGDSDNDLPDRPRLAFYRLASHLYGVYPDPDFADVSPTNTWLEAVSWAADHGVTTGYPDNTFRTNTAISRGAFVTQLWRTMGEPPTGPANTFSDVPSTYDPAVSWAVNNGIVTGYSDNTFRPSNNAPRWNLAVWIWRTLGEPAAVPGSPSYPFTDALSSTYRPAIEWLYQHGVMSGYTGSTFQPSTTAHRGHSVTWLRNMVSSPAHWTHSGAPALPPTRLWGGCLDWLPPISC